MSSGTWNPLEERYRPGLYNRFVTAAQARVQMGPRGIVGIPIKADWGPIGEMVEITSEGEITEYFGTGGTAPLIRRIMLAGKRFKPNKIVAYRMATATAEAAHATIDDVLQFTARYKGIRGNTFHITITENLYEVGIKDIKVFEGTTILATYTVAANGVSALAEAINGDPKGVLNAKVLKESGMLSDAANIPLTGGHSGNTLTAEDYLKALDAFEPVLVNVLVLDGVTDTDILLSTRSWIKRVRNDGKEIMFVQGGSAEDDKDPAKGNARSRAADSEAVVNVTVGTVYGSTAYTSAETACQIAGLIAGCPINKAITYKELDAVDDVTVHLTNDQVVQALRAGSLALVLDVDPETGARSVKVEQGINTLTTYGSEKSPKFSKIRVIRTLDAIDYDTGRYAAQNVIGELDNNADGRATLISGIKLYLETLASQNAISSDFLVGLDYSFKTEGDTVYLATRSLPVDSIERIFNTINV